MPLKSFNFFLIHKKMDRKRIYLTTRRSNDYLIFFGPKLTSKPFEEILIEHWNKSQQATGRIVIILEEVEWASLTEVIMLTMWVLYLRKMEKDVAVCFPFCGILSVENDNERNVNRRKAVCSFLSRWQFPIRLEECGVEVYGGNQSYASWTERDDPRYCKVLPIRSFTKENIENISNIQLESIVYQILSEHSCLDPFESHAFSDIIFHEISKNIFDHASSAKKVPGLISIGMIKKNVWVEDEHGTWDSFYFRKLGDRSYLQIVLSDHGRGIYNTLFEAYANDGYLNKQRYYKKGIRCEEEPYVLRYSLEKLSSRNAKSRIKFKDIPRGLAWVYDVVREYRGFISVRSGSTRIGLSFLPGHNNKFQFDHNPLADFGGTILQIILPEYKPTEILTFQLASEPFPGKSPNIHMLSIAEYWTGIEDTDENYELLLESLDATIRPLDENDVVFIDFSGISWDKDTLSEFVRKMMYLQGETLIVGYNINTDHNKLLTEVQNVFLSKDGPINNVDIRITPFIDIKGRAFFLGCREEYEKKLLQELFAVDTTDLSTIKYSEGQKEISKFIKRNQHIIRRKDDQLQIRTSLISCPELLNEAIKNKIKKVIENPPDGIMIKHDGLFHLPSGEYATKFIQLQHLFEINNWDKRLAYTLLTKIHMQKQDSEKIDFIFGCSASTFPLIKHLAEGLSFNQDEDILCIDTYLDTHTHPDFEDIPKEKNVLIVTDVISTGGLIMRMTEAVLEREAIPFAIASIVDTRDEFESTINTNGTEIKVYSLYHDFIKKNEKPIKMDKNGQLIYDISHMDVIEIDPLSASPCYEHELLNHPPVIIESNDFISNYIEKSYAIINRHVETGGTHFCFYIDTEKIFKEQTIYNDIINKIIDCLSKDLPEIRPNSLTILYPYGSNAEYATTSFISKIKETLEIEEIKKRRIFRSKSKRGWKFGIPDKSFEPIIKDKTVVIWDDGCNSGDTLYQLVNYVCSLKPKTVFVYILISRLEPSYKNFFQKIKSYGIGKLRTKQSIKITFITSLGIPTYKPNNCPCCKILEELESDSFKPFSRLQPINDHIQREKNRLKVIRLKNIREEIKAKQYISQCELSEDSIQFRKEISSLIIMREAIAKLESLVPTEFDRGVLRERIKDKENLIILGRIIRDEPYIWDKIIPQCPDVVDKLFNFCGDILIDKTGHDSTFDLIAISILFSKNKQKVLIENLGKFILKIQHSKEAMDSFIFHVIKYSDEDEMLDTLEKCSEICDAHRTHETMKESIARVTISKVIQWARLNRAQKAGSKGSLKEAIISLENTYKEDPHKSGLQWWSTLMGTSPKASFKDWESRQIWWKDELRPLFQAFVANIETLQSVLTNIPSINPYLLKASELNYFNDLTALEEKLNFLCMENLNTVDREKNYEEFEPIVRRLYDYLISGNSLLAGITKSFPTNLSQGIKSVSELLREEINKKKIKLKITKIPDETNALFHKGLFHIAFREFVFNMCKHCEENGNADLITNINESTIEIKLIHSGRLKHAKNYGIGESKIEELLCAHNGNFIYPQELRGNKIESKIIVQKW